MRKSGYYVAIRNESDAPVVVFCDGCNDAKEKNILDGDQWSYDKHWHYISPEPLDLSQDWKAKYEKAIKIIRRFDAGIIGMYDL